MKLRKHVTPISGIFYPNVGGTERFRGNFRPSSLRPDDQDEYRICNSVMVE